LRARALVDESDALSMGGLFVLTLAMRRQQEVARSREDLTARRIHKSPLRGAAGPPGRVSLQFEG
jgi:hypothetical protein